MYVCMACYVDALKYICNVVFGNWRRLEYHLLGQNTV